MQRAPAITKDNVDLTIDAVVYLKVVDPYRARYAVDDPITAMLILAQTTVRSRIGEMSLDQTFKNREELNAHVGELLARSPSRPALHDALTTQRAWLPSPCSERAGTGGNGVGRGVHEV